MSGTSLLILAMYTTVNVTGPASARLDPEAIPTLLMLLAAAAALTIAALYSEGARLPRRAGRTSPPKAFGGRAISGPKERRR